MTLTFQELVWMAFQNPLMVLIAVVFALDLATTGYAFYHWPTRVKEVNPVARFLIDKLGAVPGLAVLKIAILMLIVNLYPRMPNMALWWVLMAHVFICYNNAKVIVGLRKLYGT